MAHGWDRIPQNREALRKICDLSQPHALNRTNPAALILTIMSPVEKHSVPGKKETKQCLHGCLCAWFIKPCSCVQKETRCFVPLAVLSLSHSMFLQDVHAAWKDQRYRRQLASQPIPCTGPQMFHPAAISEEKPVPVVNGHVWACTAPLSPHHEVGLHLPPLNTLTCKHTLK